MQIYGYPLIHPVGQTSFGKTGCTKLGLEKEGGMEAAEAAIFSPGS
jgi:hypothetical protein